MSAIEIIKGEDKTIRLTLTQSGRAYDLTTLTAARVNFPGGVYKTLGSGVALVSPYTSGLVDVTLTNDDTDALPEGLNLGIEVVLEFGSTMKIKQPTAVLNVYRRGIRKA